jgi:hypothetical protein
VYFTINYNKIFVFFKTLRVSALFTGHNGMNIIKGSGIHFGVFC